MTIITPYLWFHEGAADAAEFYTSLFPDARILATAPGPDGDAMTVELELHGQRLVLLNGGPSYTLSPAFSLAITVETQEEVDRYWDALTADGGEESQCGWLVDRFGVSWQVVPEALPRLLGDPGVAGEVAQAMFSMRKLIVADLEAAAAGARG
jgi:predicted 3-demethylubiquinone-9 3-methyltransferase (glyoxalase superfamily)